MKTTLIALTAVAGLISLSAPAQAGGCHTKSCAPKPSYHRPHYQPQHYHHQTYHHQPVHSHVSYLPGHTKDFAYQCNLGKYGCKGFYSVQHKDWFYFYPQKNVYLPVKFIQQLPPVANFNQNDNRNLNTNDNQNLNQNVTNITIAPPVAPLGAGPVVPFDGPVAPTGVGPVGPIGEGPEVLEGPQGIGPAGPTGIGPVGDILPLPPG